MVVERMGWHGVHAHRRPEMVTYSFLRHQIAQRMNRLKNATRRTFQVGREEGRVHFTQKGQNAVPTDRMKDCRFGQGMESRDRAGEGQVTHLTVSALVAQP